MSDDSRIRRADRDAPPNRPYLLIEGVRVKAMKPDVILFVMALLITALSLASVSHAKTLTVALWLIPQGNIISDELIAKFEATHPGVTVELLQGPSDAYEEWIKIMLMAGVSPDIFAIGDWNIQEYRDLGIIRPIDLQAAGYSTVSALEDDYLPGALAAFITEEQVWGLPQEWNTLMLYYNQRILDEVGLAEPIWDAFSQQQFIDTATKTTQRTADGVAQRIGFTSTWYHAQLATIEWSAHLFSRGGDLFSDADDLTLDTPAARASYDSLQDIVQRRRIATNIGSPYTFREQKVAMDFSGTWVALGYPAVGIEYGLIPWPIGPETVVPAYSWAWVVSSQSQEPGLAAEFMRFVLVDHAEEYVAHTGFNLPLADALGYEVYHKRPELLSFFRAAPLARYAFQAPNYNEFSAGIQQLIWSAVGPEPSTFDQALERVGPEIQGAFKN